MGLNCTKIFDKTVFFPFKIKIHILTKTVEETVMISD